MTFNKEREAKTVGIMISMYCHRMHMEKELCPFCRSLWEYATLRIDQCVYGENKPVCTSCTVHCYRKEQREEIRRVMRFAGPKMIWTHPILALHHLFRKWLGTRHLKEMIAG